MADGPESQVELEGGEQWLRAWPVEPALPNGSSERPGWFILTSRRAVFFRRVGLFGGGRLEKPPAHAWRLEQVRSLEPRRFEMKVGYGDKVAIPGFAVEGQGFRLNRETPSGGVLEAIDRARRARRSELGLPLL